MKTIRLNDNTEIKFEIKHYSVPKKDIRAYGSLIIGSLFKIPGFTIRDSKHKMDENKFNKDNYWLAVPSTYNKGRRFQNFFVLDNEWWKPIETQILEQFIADLQYAEIPIINDSSP